VSLQLEPEADGLRIEMEAGLQCRYLVGMHAHEATLHLHVEATGVGRRAFGTARVDDYDLATLFREKSGHAQSEDPAAHHGRLDVGREWTGRSG
jgi:hypothetical protein